MASSRPLQSMLFGGAELATSQLRHTTPTAGHAAAPGTGPTGETCGSCSHCTFRSLKSNKTRNFYKCDLMTQHWTYGRETDVLKTSPACSRWVAGKPHETTVSRLRNRNWEA